MNEDDIKKFITKKVQRYADWTIGITENPKNRKGDHGNPKRWHKLRASSESVARRIEKHFISKGMKGGTGGGKDPNYVYFFKND